MTLLTLQSTPLPRHHGIVRGPRVPHPARGTTNRPTARTSKSQILTTSDGTQRAHLQFELPSASHRGVFERLDDAHVRILQRGVLADQDDLNGLVQTLSARNTRQSALHGLLQKSRPKLTLKSFPSTASTGSSPSRFLAVRRRSHSSSTSLSRTRSTPVHASTAVRGTSTTRYARPSLVPA